MQQNLNDDSFFEMQTISSYISKIAILPFVFKGKLLKKCVEKCLKVNFKFKNFNKKTKQKIFDKKNNVNLYEIRTHTLCVTHGSLVDEHRGLVNY